VAALVLAVAAAVWWWLRPPGESAYVFEAGRRMTLEVTVPAPGVVQPVTVVPVGSPAAGTVAEVLVQPGAVVTPGQPLARLDPGPWQARLDLARGRLLQVRNDSDQIQADLEAAREDYQRQKELWKQTRGRRDEFDRAYARYAALVTQLHDARLHIQTAAAAVQQAEADQTATVITAPMAGVVVAGNLSVGQELSPGSPPLFTLTPDLSRVQVAATPAEADLPRVHPGQTAAVSIPAHAGRTFSGLVTRVGHPSGGSESGSVLIQVDNPEALLQPGQPAQAAIVVARRAGVLAVPAAALAFQRPPGRPEPGRGQVWKWGPHHRPLAVPVQLGESDGRWTEILAGDVAAGDRVIVGRR